jgi:membrane protein DedA with SNARE-associated domain
MLHLTIASVSPLPHWLQTPGWFMPATHAVARFIRDHQGVGLFLVIFAEELGVPLPAPGDAAITYGGYMTTTGALALPLAYVSVILAATTGSFCLYTVSRRYGHPFLVRFGPHVGITAERLQQAETAFRSWGPWAVIIGRHIPGMRIVLSAFAGVFEFPRWLFVGCVLISSSIWAAIFLELGRALGRNSRFLFRLFPAHLVPLLILPLVLIWVFWVVHSHRPRPERSDSAARSGQLQSKAEGRTVKM